MVRLVGDGVLYWYLQEIIVLPEYQGKETFYERFGFSKSNKMNMYIEK